MVIMHNGYYVGEGRLTSTEKEEDGWFRVNCDLLDEVDLCDIDPEWKELDKLVTDIYMRSSGDIMAFTSDYSMLICKGILTESEFFTLNT